MDNDERIKLLDEFTSKFMDLKNYIINLKLASEHIRLSIEYFDNGFMRAREAIFSDTQGEKTEITLN